MTGDDRAVALALASLPGMGPSRYRHLAGTRSPAEAWRLLCEGGNELAQIMAGCRGVSERTLGQWTAVGRQVEPEVLLQRHLRYGLSVAGPTVLSGIEPWASDPEPPMVLMSQGRPVPAETPIVGVVGTRRCTAYGRSVAASLGHDLARAGVVVVSGLAVGIDGSAQRAALEAGGHVVAVVGTGLDHPYPKANIGLWRRLAVEGTLLSEYPLGVAAARWRFPARNRLVAALADVVVVVESAEKGGSMYTVEAALERDRTVLAVPGPVTSPLSAGPHRLLVEGALPARDVADVLGCLSVASRSATPHLAGRGGQPDGPAEGTAPVPSHLMWVLDALCHQPATTDELALRSQRGLGELSRALAELSALGWVTQSGGWWEPAR